MAERSRPSTTASAASHKTHSTQHTATSQATHHGSQHHRNELDPLSRRKIIFSGPDGLREHRVTPRDASYVGHVHLSPEVTSQTSYLFRVAPDTPFPKAKNGRIGETGWERETWGIKKGI